MYSTKTIKKYLDDLAAKKPAPGGGSAAALTAALGCALLSMVCNYTIGKDRYKDVEVQIKEVLKQTERLRGRFLRLVNLDVRAYYKVFKSRRASDLVYQKNLVSATKVPLEICQLCVKAYKFCSLLADKANKYLISDVYVAEELLKSSFKSAVFNVKINLPSIKDKGFVVQVKKTIQKLKKDI